MYGLSYLPEIPMMIFSLSRLIRGIGGLLLLAGLAPRPAAAQNTQIEQVPTVVQPRWIDLPPNEWRRGKNGWQTTFDYYVGVDPQPRTAGFFGQRLRREMTALGGLNTASEAALNRYRRQKRLFLTERFVFLGTLIFAGADIIQNDYDYFNNSEAVLTGVAIASLLANVWISRNTNSHLQRAVKEYQGELIPQTPGGWVPRLQPAFGGIAPQRGGGGGLVVGWRW